MITLLIPTMNRSDFLIRLLRYYRDLGFQGCICIGDSSNAEHIERTKRAIAALQGSLNIVYQEYPHLNYSATECVQQLLGFVSTPYAVLVADDDFAVPSALEQCACFLEDHPDYSAAHGVAAVISLESGGACGHVASAGYYRQPVLEEERASQRLVRFLSDYSVPMFSVRRVESWRAIFRDLPRSADTAFRGELLPGCLSIIQGKVKELDCLYMVRQAHDRRYPLPHTFDWITGESWLPSYSLFRDILAEEVAQQDGINADEAQEVVKQAFWAYLAWNLPKDWQGCYEQDNSGLHSRLRRVAQRVPVMRRTWHKVRSFLPGPDNRMSLPALLRPSSPYHADFMPIYRSITTPSNLSNLSPGLAGAGSGVDDQ